MFDTQNDLNEIDSMDKDEQSIEQSVETIHQSHELQELLDVKEKFARLTADFQNYKKRSETDRVMWIDRSRCDVLLGILAVVDNFDRALEEAKATHNESLASWLVGFELIHKALYEFLASQKVTVITQVQVFDPNLHEAVMQVQDAEALSGAIVKVFEKGFMYKDTVLRTAKVSVAA
jgi:molecular chaperone GrpE